MAGLGEESSEKPANPLPDPSNNEGVPSQSVDAPASPTQVADQSSHSSVEKDKKAKKKKSEEKKPIELRLTLTREEIEEDFFGITGMKLSRYPRKHPKTFPKHIRDDILPGQFLLSTATEDMY